MLDPLKLRVLVPNTVFHPLHYGQESLHHVCFLQFSLISVQPLNIYISNWNVQIALVTDFPRVIIITSAFPDDQKRRIDYVDTNPVIKLLKWAVTSVTSNQRKWLVEQCFDMFSVLECQIFRSLNSLHFSSLYPDSVQNWAWFCLHLSNHSKTIQTDVISSCFVSLSLVNQRRLPHKNWPITGFPSVDRWLISVCLLGSLWSQNTQDCDGLYDCCDPWTLTFMWSLRWLWIWFTVRDWSFSMAGIGAEENCFSECNYSCPIRNDWNNLKPQPKKWEIFQIPTSCRKHDMQWQIVIAHCSRRFGGAASSPAVPGQDLGGVLGATSQQPLIILFFTVSEINVALKNYLFCWPSVSENLFFHSTWLK